MHIMTDQKILLLTHLCYFGYCFNPVSFYYILSNKGTKHPDDDCEEESIDAIVAEVSNTPWNEMKCYVLHPKSKDMKKVQEGRPKCYTEATKWKMGKNDLNPSAQSEFKDDATNHKQENTDDKHLDKYNWKSINYIFLKTFHVSPFMDMEHIYDWTFWNPTSKRIAVSTTMKKERRKNAGCTNSAGGDEHNGDKSEVVKYFNAYFDIYRQPFTPFALCYQLIRLPVYCMIIQVWIHWEAMRLLWKGVEFIPHPDGAESEASKLIGTMMSPFFMIQEWMSKRNEPEAHEKVE